MTKELRRLSQQLFRKGQIGPQNNKVRLSISNPRKQMRMAFQHKPDRKIRADMRLKGYKWSRNLKSWHSRLSNTQIARTKRIMKQLEYIQRQF